MDTEDKICEIIAISKDIDKLVDLMYKYDYDITLEELFDKLKNDKASLLKKVCDYREAKKEPIDEEKLNEITWKYLESLLEEDAEQAYKAGYRKAKEE